MNHAVIQSVVPGSAAAEAGVLAGDEVVAVSGRAVRDIIEYRWMTDEEEVSLDLLRGGLELSLDITKAPGTPLGMEIDSPVFDEVRTCDNHCEFCFIYQLPPGMRKSLYLKDDDYRLSFLYGNFTTLTRFTEADVERVLTEGLSPLYVSIHATDPTVRSEMLRNKRGGMSLRWLRVLLDAGIEVHGQVVVCPGINDGAVLGETLTGVLDEYPELADVAVVPLGVSRFNTEPRMRPHTRAEAEAVVDQVEAAQMMFSDVLGRPMVHAADEYYLLSGRDFPAEAVYGDFSMHEDGIGMARAFAREFSGGTDHGIGAQPGFFNWVDGAPAEGYRAPRQADSGPGGANGGDGDGPGGANGRGGDGTGQGSTSVVTLLPRRDLPPRGDMPVGILSGAYGAMVLGPIIADLDRSDVRVIPVQNHYFGGNIAVTGLMVGEDLATTLAAEPAGHRYLLPDVCLSRGRFLDGMSPEDLPHPVEVVPTDGVALRKALAGRGTNR